MGNKAGVGDIAVGQGRPEQFVTQAISDWEKQAQELLKTRSTFIKTVILPPGVQLSDHRLTEGVVVSEKKYLLPSGTLPQWPEHAPFECDVDGRLLPPCWGTRNTHAHYVVYPDHCFPELNCGFCMLHQDAHPEEATPIGKKKPILKQPGGTGGAVAHEDEFLETEEKET